MAAHQPGKRKRCRFHFFGGRRKPREEREPQPRRCLERSEEPQHEDLRGGGSRRRLHRQGRRLRGGDTNGRDRPCHSPYRGVPGGGVALPRLQSSSSADRYEVVGGRRAVFLDRDGVLNEAIVREGRPYAPASLAGIKILPGVKEALQSLREAGFLNIVVTNQPDVATG